MPEWSLSYPHSATSRSALLAYLLPLPYTAGRLHMTSPHDAASAEHFPSSASGIGISGRGISDEQYRLIVQSIKDYAVFMLDPEGRIASWNEGARLIKGYTAAEISGRSFEIFYPVEAVPAVDTHDLRNPVQSVLGAAGLVEVIPSSEAHDRHVQTIQRAARRMERLISDLLDVASIESGTLSMRKAPVDLTALVSEVLELLESQARERKIEIHREIERDVPVVMGDHDRLLQVLSNLLGNAIKFTPEGGNVRLRLTRSGDEVVVSVVDTGIGISPDDLPHVFERFWRARDAKAKGVGLGLSIASGIVEAHGGRIWAESQLGVGTTMTFALPVPPAPR